MMENLRSKKEIMLKAKALYLLGDLSDLMEYLELKVEQGILTERECDMIADIITCKCANITLGTIEKFKKQLKDL